MLSDEWISKYVFFFLKFVVIPLDQKFHDLWNFFPKSRLFFQISIFSCHIFSALQMHTSKISALQIHCELLNNLSICPYCRNIGFRPRIHIPPVHWGDGFPPVKTQLGGNWGFPPVPPVCVSLCHQDLQY